MNSPEDALWQTGCRQASAQCAMDAQVPGGVYLCQVGAALSCGACCGLYNVPDLSRENLTRMLARRTERFAHTARTAAAIEAFARESERREPQQRPFAALHHCPYIGLIGERPGRAGCLLHPLADGNNGVDFRGLSYYGGMACRTYFCAATKALAPRWKQVLRQVLNHWYVFGLVVTEKELLTALFEHLEVLLACPLDAAAAQKRPVAESLGQLLSLKCRWPFRPPSHATACHYLFSDNAHPKPEIDYHGLGTTPSIYDKILREMPSAFNNLEALRRAEALIADHMAAAVKALSQPPEAAGLDRY